MQLSVVSPAPPPPHYLGNSRAVSRDFPTVRAEPGLYFGQSQSTKLSPWGRIHKTHLSATFPLKYGKLPLKLRVSLMFQGLHLSIKGFTYFLRNSFNFLRFKGKT